MTSPVGRSVGLAVALLLGWSTSVQAQWFDLRRGPGVLRMEARGGWTSVSGNDAQAASNRRYDEQLQLQLAGWAIDPRVFQFTASATPTLAQTTASGADQASRSRTTAFDVSGVFFSRRTVTLAARITRTSGSSEATLGASSEQDGSTKNLRLLFRHPYFPVRVSYLNQTGSSSWRNALVRDPIVAVRTVENLGVEMNNTKLRVRLGKNSVYDQNFSDDGGRASTTASVDHRLGWGHGSSLNTSFQYQERSGVSESRSRVFSERLSIQHTRRARSTWNVSSRRWGGQSSDFQSRTLGGQLQFDISESADAGASVVRRSASSSLGTEEGSLLVMPYVAWSGRILGTRAGLAVSGGYDRLTSQEVAADTWVDALEESHKVGATFRFLLNHIGVDQASVEIWNEDLTLRLLEGLDYDVVRLGDQTEIRVLPTGRIQEREILLVSYRFAALTDHRTAGRFLNVNGSLDSPWGGVSFGRSQRSSDAFAAGGGFDGVGYTETWVSLDMRPVMTRLGQLTLSASRRVRDTEAFKSLDDQVEAELVLPLRGRTESQVRTAFGRSRNESGVGHLVSSSGYLSWAVSRTLSVRWSVNHLVAVRSGQAAQQYLTGRGQLLWRWGQVVTQLSVDHGRRWMTHNSASTRWEVGILRRF